MKSSSQCLLAEWSALVPTRNKSDTEKQRESISWFMLCARKYVMYYTIDVLLQYSFVQPQVVVQDKMTR